MPRANDLTLVDQALALADQLEVRGLCPEKQALLDYFRSNGWACRYQRRYRAGDALWDFEQPEIQQQVLLLRRAAHGAGFDAMDAIRRCQILTNLGNQLDALGRFVEARAFGMPLSPSSQNSGWHAPIVAVD